MARIPSGAAASSDGSGFTLRLRASLLHAVDRSLDCSVDIAASRSLRAARDAIRALALDAALRELDRAWRCLPEHASTFAPIYARLLTLHGGDDAAALHLLGRAAEFGPDPDVAALLALALLRLRESERARRQLEAALSAYCVVPGELLGVVAGDFVRHPDVRAPGWIGRGPDLGLVGELAWDEHSGDEATGVLDFRFDGAAASAQILRLSSRGTLRAFSVEPPHPRALLEVTSRGAPLLGSGATLPLGFALDGRAQCSRRRVTGWARLGWAPSQPVHLRIDYEDGRHEPLPTARVPQPRHRWTFGKNLRPARVRAHRLQIAALLPDGCWRPLPDSPLLLEPAVRLAGRKPARMGNWGASPSPPRMAQVGVERASTTDVIIPVYGGHDETLACIQSVLATVDDSTPIVVVDDGAAQGAARKGAAGTGAAREVAASNGAAGDTALRAALDALAATGRVTLLRNETNQGFAASVNRALAQNPTHDAVVLNSDTRVFDDWLTRLRAAAYSDPHVGSVTPFSNSGSIASYPRATGAAIEPDDGAVLQSFAASTHPGTRVEIPVGVGFCLYLRRDCVRDVGMLDAAVFGRGYGEETDFCLRARRRGWTHRLAADVFVYHAGGSSFGARRDALLDRSQRLLNLRHPGFDRFISGFLAADPLHPLRRALDERRLLAFGGPFALLTTLALEGGVARFVAERCRGLQAQGLVPLVIKPTEAGNSRRCEVWTDALELPNLRYDIPADLPGLVALLAALRIDSVEIQHFLHLDPRVIDAVRALPRPYDVYVHDYAWICPRVTLIGGSGGYCGEPAVSVCESCVQDHGSHLGDPITVAALRDRSTGWLRAARRVFAPSMDTAVRLRRYVGDLAVEVRPHGPSAPMPPLPRESRGATVRVALIGAIGEHKGYGILLECARDACARRLPLEFVVLGCTQHDAPLLATGRVFITGPYLEAEVPYLLRRERPDLVWLPSVWPETWCYTLDYGLGSGLPVVAFDLGAIAERLRNAGRGELLPLGMPPSELNDRLLRAATAPRLDPVTASRSDQAPLSHPRRPIDNDLTQSRNIYMTDVSGEILAKVVQSEEDSESMPSEVVVNGQGFCASAQVLPLPGGLYMLSIKGGSPPPANGAGHASLPALHVGLVPGFGSDEVEFLASPSTPGAWLLAAEDRLVIRVLGPGATLILTSVHAARSENLAVKVERLNPYNSDSAGTARVARRDDTTAAPANEADWDGAAAPLRTRIAVHIRTRGDMSFCDRPWAGCVAPGLWIESFSVQPLEGLAPADLEYKGLTGSGFETPWMSDDQMCGTQGLGVPLVGFAIRLKPGLESDAYDCEYSGYFQSGATVTGVRDGAPCCSSVAHDPLEGIQIRLVKRPELMAARDSGFPHPPAPRCEPIAGC